MTTPAAATTTPRPNRSAPIRVAAAVTLAVAAGVGAAATDSGSAWVVAGRQGVIAHVIVPAALARDRAAYAKEIESICAGRETCFVNFYTNTRGAALEVPLPEAISHEATAVLRRSAKQGAEGFRWSCRLAMPEPDCF